MEFKLHGQLHNGTAHTGRSRCIAPATVDLQCIRWAKEVRPG